MSVFPWTMSWAYLKAKITLLAEMGFPEDNSMAILGLENGAPLPRSTDRIPVEKALAIFKTAEQATGRENIGLEAGYKFRVSEYGDTGGIFTHCENIKDVSKHNTRYQPLTIDMAKIWFSETPNPETGETEYIHNYALYDHDSVSDPNRYKHLIDIVFGAYGTAFRWLSWASAKELKAVCFQYKEPKDTEIYRTAFNCPVYFDQPHNMLKFDEDAALATMSTFDPVKRAQLVARLDAVLDSSVAAESFTEALSKTLRQKMSQGRITRSLIADALGMSDSKFAEALKTAGISYKETLDQERRSMIQELMATDTSLTEIAQSLGYNDQAAFNKAFQRLFGMSPSAYRSGEG